MPMESLLVALDTNQIYPNSGEPLSAALRSTIEHVERAGARLSIPDPVRVEVKNKFREQVANHVSTLVKTTKALSRFGSSLTMPVSDDQVEFLCIQYQASFDALVNEVSMVSIPFETPDIATMFKAAAEKRAPFPPDGNAWRDAVILYSLYARATRNPGEHILFVTEENKVGTYKTDAAPKNFSVVNHKRMTEILSEQISAGEKSRADLIGAKLKKQISDYLPEVYKFILENARWDPEGAVGDRVREVLSFNPFPKFDIENVSGDSSLNFTVRVYGRIEYSVMTTYAKKYQGTLAIKRRLSQMKKIGEAPVIDSMAYYPESPWADMPTVEHRRVHMAIEVDCKAQLLEEKLSDVEILSISRIVEINPKMAGLID